MVPACAAPSLTYSIERCVQQGGRRSDSGGNGAGDLAAQRYLALFGDIALLAEPGLPDQLRETVRIERAIRSLEVRIVVDLLHDVVGGLLQAEAIRGFVQRGLRDHLLQHLAIQPECAGLIRRQRSADLAADLLQPISIDLAELLGRNLGVADRRHRRFAEAFEDVADAPHTEADNQNAHDQRHDGFAEPVR